MTAPTTTNEGRGIATKGTDHVAHETAPDVCLTPSNEPKPFPNWVESKKLAKGQTTKTFIDGHPVWTRAGELGPPSEPAHEGSVGGITSGTYRFEARATSYSPNVFCEAEAVVRTDDTTTQNHGNTTGIVALVAAGDSCEEAPQDQGDKKQLDDPIDAITGRMFTFPVVDVALPGPLPLSLRRLYSSRIAHRDIGMGYGWMHSLGWVLDTDGREVRVFTDEGIAVRFESIPTRRNVVLGRWGWILSRRDDGFELTTNDGLIRVFAADDTVHPAYHLRELKDNWGNTILVKREAGSLVAIEDSAGRIVHAERAPCGRIGALTMQVDGRRLALVRYAYDEAGRLVRVTDALGHHFTYAYDALNLLVSETDRAGTRFHFRYDGEGRCFETWCEHGDDGCLGDGLAETLADQRTPVKGMFHVLVHFTGQGNTEVVDASRVSRYDGNGDGFVTASRDADGAVERDYDDESGRLLGRRDARGAAVRFERDDAGRIVSAIDPLGHRTHIERHALGGVSAIVDAAGAVTHIERDARGCVVGITDACGGKRGFAYDERGLLATVVDRNGEVTRVEYDAMGNAVTSTRSDGAVWRWTYDELGRVITESNPEGGTRRYRYSDRSEVVAIEDPGGGHTTLSYDKNGRLTRVVGPTGAVTELTWGGFNLLCAARDASGRSVEFRYDLRGRLVEVHNPAGEVLRLSYDGHGRRSEERSFDGRTVRYEYDAAGYPVRIVGPGPDRVSLNFDPRGQLAALECADGRTRFVYDANGALVSATSPAVTVQLDRDALGRVLRDAQVVDGEEHWVDAVYAADGGLRELRTSCGHSQRHESESGGRRTIRCEGREIVQFHDSVGRELLRLLPEGGCIETRYSAAGRVAERTIRAVRRRAREEPSWVAELDLVSRTGYVYDAAAQLLEVVDSDDGWTRYQRGAAGDLVGVFGESASREDYRYDACGNLFHNCEPRVYGTGGLLLARGTTEYRYDARGRLAEKTEARRIWRYTWSSRDRLESVERPDGSVVSFTYDAFGRRLQKRVTSREGQRLATVRFVWHRNRIVHEIADGRVRTYLHGNRSYAPLAHRDDNGPWMHYVEDSVGAPRRLVDEHGRLIAQVRRNVWGMPMPGDIVTPIGLPGQYYDVETGLAYNRYRYYDPEVARYISPDPTGLRGGLNAFAYVHDPTGWIDPLGLDGFPTDLPDKIYPRSISTGIFDTGPIDAPGWEGCFFVHTHGDEYTLLIDEAFDTDGVADGWTGKPEDIKAWLNSSPGYKPGMCVVLVACETGKLDTWRNSGGTVHQGIARQLSTTLRSSVFGATGYVNTMGRIMEDHPLGSAGNFFRWLGIASGWLPNEGAWRRFDPDDPIVYEPDLETDPNASLP